MRPAAALPQGVRTAAPPVHGRGLPHAPVLLPWLGAQIRFPGHAQDDDPYVRKTAAVCVAKLYDIAPELVEDRGFLDTLQVDSFHDGLSFLAYVSYYQ